MSSPHRDTFPDRGCVVTIVPSVTIAVRGVQAGGVTLLGHLDMGMSDNQKMSSDQSEARSLQTYLSHCGAALNIGCGAHILIFCGHLERTIDIYMRCRVIQRDADVCLLTSVTVEHLST